MRLPGIIGATAHNKEQTRTTKRARTPGPQGASARRNKAFELSTTDRRILTGLDANGMADISERAMFLGQMAHETDGFRRLRENFSYSAKRLHEVFPKKFKTVADAKKVVEQGQAAIAEAVYGGRADLGNSEVGDGARFIGRGYIHLTGRANYIAAGTATGLDLINHPELAEIPENALTIAIWYWKARPDLRVKARAGDVKGATRIINGGENGLADRQVRYREYLRVLSDTTYPGEVGTTPPLP
jgi:putative chitinase